MRPVPPRCTERERAGDYRRTTRAESLDIAESGAVPDDEAHALVSGVGSCAGQRR